MRNIVLCLFCAALFCSSFPSSAEEGMWTYDNPPIKHLKEQYGFTPTQEWLDHLRLSSVRFNDGGSGSFISPTGLVLTNHHVALGQLQKVSTANKNYVRDGFYARTAAEEMKSPDLELNQLVSMENVTRRVAESVKSGMNEEQAHKARTAETARIEKESLDSTGLRSDVVSFYGGAERWLYRYKKYTDVRLVFAPEQQTAFWGGDLDNFTFPRYDLDMAIFRIFENGKPAATPHYLKWNSAGASAGELVFVSGNPGSTQRMKTVSQIERQRDDILPANLKALRERLDVLVSYGSLSPEQLRQAADQIFSIQNSIKAQTGQYEGLLDERIMAKIRKEESNFRSLVSKNPELQNKYGDAWDQIARADKKELERIKEIRFRTLGYARLARIALSIVQYVEQVKKPDGERIDGYHDSQLPSLRFRLFSPAPVYPQLDKVLLTYSLGNSLRELGQDDPFVKAALGGQTPAQAAGRAIDGTRLQAPDVRRKLVDGGESAVRSSSDPAIELARRVNPMITELEEWRQNNVQSVLTSAGEKLGMARFAVYGKSEYPDANFTLRLAYGKLKGYPMNGTEAPPITTFYGLYDRAYSFGLRFPFDLTDRWQKIKGQINLSTPFNFVSTCDIIGGNSGSPVVNRAGELVGLIFDGNIESLVGSFLYQEEGNRAVAVHAAAMTEALRKVYGASALADEIERPSK
jgi:hypothetical protein